MIARPVSKIAIRPQHDHDCDDCRFLGAAGTHDLYFCPGHGGAYIVRHSSRDYDNGSFGLDMGLPPPKGSLYALAAAIVARKLPPRHYRIDG